MSPTPADLRARIARAQVHRYKLAALRDQHPVRFGRALNGKVPLSREMALKISAALDHLERETEHAVG